MIRIVSSVSDNLSVTPKVEFEITVIEDGLNFNILRSPIFAAISNEEFRHQFLQGRFLSNTEMNGCHRSRRP